MFGETEKINVLLLGSKKSSQWLMVLMSWLPSGGLWKVIRSQEVLKGGGGVGVTTGTVSCLWPLSVWLSNPLFFLDT